MTDDQRMAAGRRIETGFGMLIGAIGLVCLAFVIWFASMMFIHRVVSIPALAGLGVCILIASFFLKIAWKVTTNRPGRVLSTFTLYLLATLFFSLALLFFVGSVWKRDPWQIEGILLSAIFGYICIKADQLLKRRGSHDR